MPREWPDLLPALSEAVQSQNNIVQHRFQIKSLVHQKRRRKKKFKNHLAALAMETAIWTAILFSGSDIVRKNPGVDKSILQFAIDMHNETFLKQTIYCQQP